MTPLAIDTTPTATLAFERELGQIIVGALNLETPAEQIDPAAPLFNEGLGLDSIDMLEIALVISQRYGCSLRSDDANNVRTFSSLRTLAQYVASHRTQ